MKAKVSPTFTHTLSPTNHLFGPSQTLQLEMLQLSFMLARTTSSFQGERLSLKSPTSLQIQLMYLCQRLVSEVLLQAADSDGIHVGVKLIGEEVVLLNQPLQVPGTIHTDGPNMAAVTHWIYSLQCTLFSFMPRPLHQPSDSVDVCHVIFGVGRHGAGNAGDALDGGPEELVRTVGVVGPLYQCLDSLVLQHAANVASAGHDVGIPRQEGQVERRGIFGLASSLTGMKT